LQFRSDERRNGITFTFLRRDIIDDERLLPRFSNDLISLGLIVDDDLVLLEILIEAAGFDGLLVDLEQA
jgi:hypothetical protein